MRGFGRLIALGGLALFSACGGQGGVRFELSNKTLKPLFYESVWVNIGDAEGNPLQLVAPDCAQRCGQSPLLCAPRSGAEAVAAPSRPQIAPGETEAFVWNGRYFRDNIAGQCTEEVAAPPGRYHATLCWDYVDTSIGGPSKKICAVETFELGMVTEITHKVIETPPDPVVIQLRNGTGTSVWTGEGFENPNWLQLLGPDGQPLLGLSCGCICNSLCPLCGRTGAAPLPVVVELTPGQELRSDFDGRAAETVDIAAGRTCVVPSFGPPGQYTARFCWGRGHQPQNPDSFREVLTDVVCEDKHFTLGVDRAVLQEVH